MPSRNFDYQFHNIEFFKDRISREVHRYTEEGNVKNGYFSYINQSRSLGDRVTEIMFHYNVSKDTNSENEISVNVEFDEVIPSLDEVCKNRETV